MISVREKREREGEREWERERHCGGHLLETICTCAVTRSRDATLKIIIRDCSPIIENGLENIHLLAQLFKAHLF